jgi:membrane associated rhomboid family serine protease
VVVHRLNTYPLIHTGLVHALLNLIALTPLLERFEREIGTLKTTLLIAGRGFPWCYCVGNGKGLMGDVV